MLHFDVRMNVVAKSVDSRIFNFLQIAEHQTTEFHTRLQFIGVASCVLNLVVNGLLNESKNQIKRCSWCLEGNNFLWSDKIRRKPNTLNVEVYKSKQELINYPWKSNTYVLYYINQAIKINLLGNKFNKLIFSIEYSVLDNTNTALLKVCGNSFT